MPLAKESPASGPSKHHETDAVTEVFDAEELKRINNEDIPDHIIDRLQKECGDDIALANDKYHVIKETHASALTSQVDYAPARIRTGQKAQKEVKHFIEQDQYYDTRTRQWVLTSAAKRPKPKKQGKCVMFIRRVYTERRIYSHTVVIFQGAVLRNAMRNIFRNVEGFGLGKDESVELKDEIRYLYWAKPELVALANHFEEEDNKDAHFEIQAGLAFIMKEWKHTHQALEALLPHQITFEHLWAILPPDCLIVGNDTMGERNIWRLRRLERTRTEDNTPILILHSQYVDWDGNNLGIAEANFHIREFLGIMRISDLPFVPLRYHPKSHMVIRQVQTRNEKKLQSFCKHGFYVQDHEGKGLTQKDDEAVPYTFTGRVIVDPEMFDSMERNDSLVPDIKLSKTAGRVWMSDLENETDETEQQLISRLLVDPDEALNETPDHIGVANCKFIGAFSVDRLSDVQWDDSVLESLVMQPSLKSMLFRLITSHAADLSNFDDFIRGKGKGFIGLLFGPPGSGKTLTAEAIAETAHMPLYTVSSGALGATAETIYESLTEILKLATHWSAVLLLDEADVFLAKRNMTDLKRNAIVSVFLRELEYYHGILLLTTNQVDIIDEAFQSRIHFFHKYPSLDIAARKKIWTSFIERARDSVTVNIGADGIKKLAEQTLNGRQIKNAMSIALKLAKTPKPPSTSPCNSLTTEDILGILELVHKRKAPPKPPAKSPASRKFALDKGMEGGANVKGASQSVLQQTQQPAYTTTTTESRDSSE
ncbi:hypothetical protein CMEL01_16553 [Colletotrichum melonis]|uniref:AAA+ ATPase domain-containing protein n=1 Tax=Colletotrichum melonis TaxID=1209925 RepID=A0AAI9UD18_9PEZI|nr:hypothetical protein CMEL01_16553 [Colletotrichum melonis]